MGAYSSGSKAVERAHTLLNPAPVDNGARLEKTELVGKDTPLLLKADNGRLPENDTVDGAGGRYGR
jgi:hypothetical protein